MSGNDNICQIEKRKKKKVNIPFGWKMENSDDYHDNDNLNSQMLTIAHSLTCQLLEVFDLIV